VVKLDRVRATFSMAPSMVKVALNSPHCNVKLLQYLADHKYWPTRADAADYIRDAVEPLSVATAEVVRWLRDHYWWIG
jgi:hypothetical protein